MLEVDRKEAHPSMRGPRLLFLLGTVLPAVWALWVIWTVALGNSSSLGARADHRYFREVPEHWISASLLTLTGVALIWMAARSRRATTIVFASLTSAAALMNWLLLLS